MVKKKSGIFEKYKHHGSLVWTITQLKGKHETVCLCWNCQKFRPSKREENCPISNTVYSLCVLKNLVLPVWECPEFKEGKPEL